MLKEIKDFYYRNWIDIWYWLAVIGMLIFIYMEINGLYILSIIIDYYFN